MHLSQDGPLGSVVAASDAGTCSLRSCTEFDAPITQSGHSGRSQLSCVTVGAEKLQQVALGEPRVDDEGRGFDSKPLCIAQASCPPGRTHLEGDGDAPRGSHDEPSNFDEEDDANEQARRYQPEKALIAARVE